MNTYSQIRASPAPAGHAIETPTPSSGHMLYDRRSDRRNDRPAMGDGPLGLGHKLVQLVHVATRFWSETGVRNPPDEGLYILSIPHGGYLQTDGECPTVYARIWHFSHSQSRHRSRSHSRSRSRSRFHFHSLYQ
jgi:hypothetical protein